MAKGKYQRWLEPDGLLLLTAWARDGLTNEQIAHNCRISRQTLNEWCNTFPAISDALKKGKEAVDAEVENALLKRALGYETIETMEEEGPEGKRIRTIRKRVPPDVTAQIFWLKNRRPDKWRDKPPQGDTADDVLENAREILGGVQSAIR